MDRTIRVGKTKALIIFAVTAKLICTFVFAYAKSRFSHDAAHMLIGISLKQLITFFYKFNYILRMYYLKQYNYINQLHHIKLQLLHICEKGQYQLHVNTSADKCLCFCCIDTNPLLLNLRFQASSYILKFSTRFQKPLDRFSHDGTNEN